MDDARELLELTAEIAADYLESLGERPVLPTVTRRGAARALGGRCRTGRPTAREGGRGARRRRSSRGRRDPERSVLRLRHRRRAAGGARGGLADLGLGPERRPLRRRPLGLGGRGGGARVARRAARPARGRVGRLRDRRQMAHVTALAAARYQVLHAVGWDVERDGLFGAPPIRVLVGAKRHVTVDRALRMLGLGTLDRRRPGRRPGTDATSTRSRARSADGDGPTIVCAQAGEVNTGAFDALAAIADARRGGRRLAARRRRVRALGCGDARAARTSRGRRARRLVGDRRAQVAQRPVRLGRRLLRAPASRTAPR